MCVGSGKTLTAVSIIAQLFLESIIDRCLIIVPSLEIKGQFSRYSEASCINPDGAFRFPRIIEIDDGYTLRGRFDLTRSHSEPLILVTTYNCWRNNFEALAQTFHGNWNRTLLVIDEGHHVYDPKDSEGIGLTAQTILRVRSMGAKTLQMTATAARYDGRNPHLRDLDGVLDPKIERSLLQHIYEGYAPFLTSDFLRIRGHSSSESQDAFGVPMNESEGFLTVLEDMIKKASNPLAIFRIQCQREEQNRRVRERFRNLCLEHGRNPLIWIHESQMDPRDESRMARLRELCHNGASYEEIREVADTLIVHQKLNEGVDLPPFSNMYLWGVPYSMPLIEQLIGRIMRLRAQFETSTPIYPGYPLEWLHTGRIVFCSTVLDGDPTQDKLMHQLGGWLFSLELGTLLRRIARLDDRLFRPNGANGVAPSRHRIITNIEALSRYLNEAQGWFANLKHSPLSNFTPINRAKILTEYALISALNSNLPSILGVTEMELSADLDLMARQLVSEMTRNLAPVNDILEPDLDPDTQPIVDQFRHEFNERSRADHTIPRWIIQGELQEHYARLGHATGVTVGLEQAVQKAREFHLEHGRWPGSFGRPLTQERVPGEAYPFSNYYQDWRRELAKMSPEERTALIREGRLNWIRFAGEQGIHGTNREMQMNQEIQKHPLFVYYPEVLWVPPYPWTESLTSLELRGLGEWSIKASRAVRFDQNLQVLHQVESFLETGTVQELKNRIRERRLETILVAEAAV